MSGDSVRVTAVAKQKPAEKMMDEMSEYLLRDLRSSKKEFQFRRTEAAGGLDSPAEVGSGCDVVEAFRAPILQIDGVKNEPGGLAGDGVAERRESLEDARRCVGLY